MGGGILGSELITHIAIAEQLDGKIVRLDGKGR